MYNTAARPDCQSEENAPAEYDIDSAMAYILGDTEADRIEKAWADKMLAKFAAMEPDEVEPSQPEPVASQQSGWSDEWFFDYKDEPTQPELDEPVEVSAPVTAAPDGVEPEPEPRTKYPAGPLVANAVIQSAAFLSLSGWAGKILLFALSRRVYSGKGCDYWNPDNRDAINLPYRTIREYFAAAPPADKTISQALDELMAVGFVAQIKQGGSAKGNTSVFRLEDGWRTWKAGDGPVFTKAPKVRGRSKM